MSKILTKKIQIRLSDYFSSTVDMSKPEARCLKEMALGSCAKNRMKFP